MVMIDRSLAANQATILRSRYIMRQSLKIFPCEELPIESSKSLLQDGEGFITEDAQHE